MWQISIPKIHAVLSEKLKKLLNNSQSHNAKEREEKIPWSIPLSGSAPKVC